MSGKIIKWLKALVYGFLGWIFIVPLSYIIPKKENLIIFIGSKDGRFIDNVKYFFLYLYKLSPENVEFYFLTENRNIFKELKKKNFPVIFYPAFPSIFKLLRASVVIIDNWWWFSAFKYHLLFKSYKVQLWHGIGLKKIELNVFKPGIIVSFLCTIIGRYPVYDLLISTSEFFTKKFFSGAIKTKFVLESGYPRNDSFFMEPDEFILIGTDKENFLKIKEFKAKNYKIILYVPTFRDSGGDPIKDNILDISVLSEFARENNLIFVFKFHLATNFNYGLDKTEHIIEYNNSKDIYPVFPLIDLMITDYSSIYLDYLLLDKPVAFFSYDYEKYICHDREIHFDYNWITPGPKCKTQEELQSEIVKVLIEGKDEYKDRRKEILKIAFTHKDGQSSERIWDFIKTKKFK